MNITLTGEVALAAQKGISLARSMWPALDGVSDEDIVKILINTALTMEAST